MTIAEIEDKIAERLKAKGLQVRDIDIQKGVEGIPLPAVYIAAEEGKFEQTTQNAFEQTISILLYMVFKHLKGEKERRRGIYPILEGIVGMLTLQNMGLKIAPLKPLSFRNITDGDLQANNLIVYQIEFETSYHITKVDDEAATSLLKIGLDYYLKPGDENKDASDLLTLQGG